MFTRNQFLFGATLLCAAFSFAPRSSAQSIPTAEDSILFAGDAAGLDQFGRSVHMDQDRILIGAPFNALGITSAQQGSASVFVRTGTSWNEEFRLTANDGADQDRFGSAVVLAGDWAAVGAPRDQDNGLFSGSVYLFQRSGTAWIQQGKLTPHGAAAGDQFGFSLDMDGDNLIVGAPSDSSVVGEGGSAHVYVRTGTVWNFQDTLLASDNAEMDLFGTSVAIDGDRAAIGASMDESPNAQRGKAYVFVRTGSVWTEETILDPSDSAAFAHMGRSIALLNDVLIVGAPERALAVGGAYVYRRTGTVWAPEDVMLPSDGVANDFFGAALAMVENRVVIGSPFQSELALRSGAVYLFEATGSNWNEVDKLFASNLAADDRFGSSVAYDGTRFVVGSPQSDTNGQESGSAYAFRTPEFSALCFGDGGVTPGCTSCPCGNDAAPGTLGGCTNSSGGAARLTASGNPSVSLPSMSTNDLRLAISDAPPLGFCLLNSGDAVAPTNAANPCFGLDSGVQSSTLDGLRCAVMNTRRHGGRSADSNGDVGTTNNPWGGEGGPPVGIASGFVAGQTRYFQVIHRDAPLQVCARGLNTSNAVELTFFP